MQAAARQPKAVPARRGLDAATVQEGVAIKDAQGQPAARGSR